MAIDLPPTLPPVQATEVQVKNYASSPASAITANINDIQLKVFGDTYLGNDEIVQLIESSKTPSDAIIRLSNRYYEAGHLLMKIRYYRSLDAIYVTIACPTKSKVTTISSWCLIKRRSRITMPLTTF